MIDKKKKHNRGVIIGFLNFLSEWISECFCNGLFGKIFTSYNSVEAKAKNGLICSSFARKPGGREKSIRRKLLMYFDQSLIMYALRKVLAFLKSCRVNFYGVFLATFGAYSLLFNFVKSFFESGGSFSVEAFTTESFWGGIILIIAAIPLLNSKKLLLTAIKESRMASAFLEKSVGVEEEKYENIISKNGIGTYFIGIALGVLAGGISYFTGPINVILCILTLLALGLVFNFPEFGVIMSIALAPFLGLTSHPSAYLATFVTVTLLAYAIKVSIGKRTFTFRLIDGMVLIFATLIFMGGIVTSGGMASLKSASMYLILLLVYFLIVNLINTKEWIDRCILSVAVPSILVSALGIIGYATLSMPAKWLDSAMFAGITSRAIATFENPNMLATYLLLTAPFIWIHIGFNSISKRGRILTSIGAALNAGCLVLTWSRGGWVGILVAALVFLLINCKHIFKYLVLILATSPVWVRILPDNMVSRFMSIGNLTDSSTYYRMYTWKGSFKMFLDHIMGGIGVGDAAFKQIYPIYSYIGNEATMHSHNLFLEVAVSLGIFGLIVFLILLFMVVQRGFGCLKDNRGNKYVRLCVSAGIAGFVGALSHGMVDYIWYNFRVFFMFWVVASLICVCANVFCKRENENVFESNSNNEASLDIVFGK